MGSFLRVRDRQPEGGSSREKEEEEWERRRERIKRLTKRMREEERKRPTGLCRWPLYEKFQYSTHFESAVRAGRYSRKLSSWTLWSSLTIHTHRRGSRTPNRGVSLFGRRFFFGLFDSLTLVSVSFLAVCVLCAFVYLCVCVVDKWVRVSLHFGYGCVVHHGARSLLLVRDQQWRIAPSSSGR